MKRVLDLECGRRVEVNSRDDGVISIVNYPASQRPRYTTTFTADEAERLANFLNAAVRDVEEAATNAATKTAAE